MKNLFVLIVFTLFFSISSEAFAEEVTVKIYPTDDAFTQLYDNERISDWSIARNYLGEIFRDPISAADGDQMVVRSDKQALGFYRIYRVSMLFDTSIIPDDVIILGGSINVFKSTNNNTGNTELVFTSHERASAELSKEDWKITNYGTESFSRGLLVDSVYTKFSLSDSALAYINIASSTILGVRTGFDFDDIDRGTINSAAAFYSIEASDTGVRPYLEITYEVADPEVEKTIGELLDELTEAVEESDTDVSVKNSYIAHLKKILSFSEAGQDIPAQNQLEQFIKKVLSDLAKEKISAEDAAVLLAIANQVMDKLTEEVSSDRDVPLLTQIASPYPPESADWSEFLYAAGRANYSGSCGSTIKQCGCALASFAMLGQGYGMKTGIDGSAATPPNIDAWLLANDGYDAFGNILWNQAIKYFGKEQNGKAVSFLEIDSVHETDQAKIDKSLTSSEPVIIKTKASNRDGSQFTHFILGTQKLAANYLVNDPLWYNTENLDDDRDRADWVQDYNNRIDSGQLFTYHPQGKQVAQSISIHLGSPAELLLTDAEGRRVGYDPETGEYYTEIPGAQYYAEEAVYSEELAASGVTPHVTKIIDVQLPEDTLYTLEVVGTDTGEYRLSVHTNDSNGEGALTDLTASTTPGERDAFIVDVEPGDTELLDLIDQAVDLLLEEPSDYQSTLLNRLMVLRDKVEKGNTIAADSLFTNLLRYLENRDVSTTEELMAILAEIEALQV